MVEAPELLDVRVSDFLERLGSEELSPAGGSVAAVTVAMAAGVLEKVARTSRERWPDAGGVVAQAAALRKRAAALAQTDADAYSDALRMLREPGESGDRRDFAIGRALSRAADVPLRIVETAADIASLATVAAEEGDAAVRPDAAAAAVLAEAAARAASHLVAANLLSTPEDARVRRARELERAASEAARRAVATPE